MKNQLTRIFCLFMALQVLFASTGFAMYEHFCKIKGEKTYSLSVPKKRCCPPKKANNEHSKKIVLKRAKCCSDHVAHYKITPYASQNLKVKFNFELNPYVSTPLFVYAFASIKETISFNTLHYSNSAPPLSGRDILVRNQSFLI
ncbi:hypothetical protein LV89_01256 [Arcicella aurantiaca]|uniref:Uncharacterized protein n=1 Tax=Arcicella aurantiaca TaxID=591202 RepID=A0A316ECX4_9BACT|nr:hypothetical protein [Arcicella aurantiaca]PWK27849.1 hypothetical protein LV89_01256 [Arcicella aurantiaca]